jgi:hypothetical protein
MKGPSSSCLLVCHGARPSESVYLISRGLIQKVAYRGCAPFRRARPYCLLDWQGAHSKVNQARK